MADVVLDREQREALRREIGLTATEAGDLAYTIARCDRPASRETLRRLTGMAALLDCIGWAEQDGAPDEQPVTLTPEAAWWAGVDRRALAVSLGEIDVRDVDLLALAALGALGG
jgi:hypothetical protein